MPENRTSQDERTEFNRGAGAGTKAGAERQEMLRQPVASPDGNANSKISNFIEEEKTLVIDVQALIYRLIERWIFIVGMALAGAVVMTIAVFGIITPKYEATSKLYVLSASDSAVNLSDLQIGAYLTSDYQEVFTNWEVHQQVIDNLGLGYSYEELEEMLSIVNPSDTRILRITVRSDDPQEAMDIANEYANVARRYIGITMKTEEPMIMSEALLPVKPVSPKKALDIFLGFFVGGLLAAGIVVVQFIQDDKIRTAEDILKYGDMATLAVVPAAESDSNSRGGNRGERK